MRKLKIQELKRLSPEEYIRIPKHPLVVVLDNVRSSYNVGAVFRTADAYLVRSLYLCGITAVPPNRDIHKTALGASETVDWKHFKHTREAVQQLKEEGYLIIAIEQMEGSSYLQDYPFQPAQKYAFIFGNEVGGISDDLIDLIDHCIEIPQFGTKHSLNIAVSAGIALWDWFTKAGH